MNSTEILSRILNPVIGAALGTAAAYISLLLEKRIAVNRDLEEKTLKTDKLRPWVMCLLGTCSALSLPGPDFTLLYTVSVLCVLMTLSVTDIKYRIIPNSMVLALIGIKTAFCLPSCFGIKGFPEISWGESLIGAAVCFSLFLAPMLFKGSVGAGDVKLAGAAGYVLGWRCGLICIAGMGLAVLGFVIFRKRMPSAGAAMERLKEMIPMGPAIAASAAAVMLISNAYPLGGLIA